MSKDNQMEDALARFAASMENSPETNTNVEDEPVEKNIVNESPKTVVNPPLPGDRQRLESRAETLGEAKARRQQEALDAQKVIGSGYLPVDVESLPSRGLFYPENTRIMIRAASGAEIRHWSTISDDDLSSIDDALNYILERCVSVKFPESEKPASWKDLKEIDRFYLILAIRDFTFTEGNNELKITVSEGKEVNVHKDDIEFIEINEKLMKYYNPDKRCFTFRVKNPAISEINIYMPSVGVSQWLKNYVQKKSQRQEGFDQDFIRIAPMIIRDYRGLTDSTYEQFLTSCYTYGAYEYTLIAKVRKMIEEAITPKMRYIDEAGAEQTAPLNFRGGIHSLFLLDMEEFDF